MEVKLSPPETVPASNTRSGVFPNVFSQRALQNQPEVSSSAEIVKKAESDEKAFDRKTLADITKLTVELLTTFDRELKYEVLEESGLVQIQVIDSRDGRIVRKIPSDEVVKFIEAIKEKIDDRVDVWA
jgi:uncharacterized FlaG/YvyC family protein